ncbi:MAG: phosphoglucosamine mutase [Bacteroidetes bacterium]|nr:phosphoglucosamine mutase [Bacteroidota bacterium]
MTLIKSISGIRGTIGGEPGNALTPLDVAKYALAFGSYIKNQGGKRIIIGRDARISGEMVQHIVVGNLMGLGLDVVDVGLVPTPTVEMAVIKEDGDAGIILTASHNPKQWNALKLLNEDGEFISAAAGQEVLDIAEAGNYDFAEVDQLGKYSVLEHYVDRHIEMILDLDLVDVNAISAAGFKVVVDGINSVGGTSVPPLLKALGVKEVVELYCVPDGKFAHNPEPLPENLSSLCADVKFNKADIGISVDPDVDRLALVDEKGETIGEEYTLVTIADYMLKDKGGVTVSNLSSSKALQDVTELHGGYYFPSAVGELNVVEKMKEVNAILGGEGNGGVILPELHYGRDALVGIALVLTYMAKSKKSLSTLRSSFPNYYIHKDKAPLEASIDLDDVMNKISDKYASQPQNKVDGLKITFDTDWVHLRRSNTEPIIRIYAESQTEQTAKSIALKIKGDITEIIKQ